MVISKLISGLGNQLFQYAIGRQLSIQKNTTLKLDVSFFENQNLRSYKLNKYCIKAEVSTNKEIKDFFDIYNNQSIKAKIYRKSENLMPRRYRKVLREQSIWKYDPDILKASSKVYLDGYWQNFRYYQDLSPLIFEELVVNENYNDKIKKLISEVELNKSSVSLHIRRGDYITDTEANKFMGILPLDYYYKAITHIINNVSNPELYIFSDDLDWAKDNLKTHLPINLIDIENGTKDYIELDIMSKCRHNIIANSSFSWWGAFLNKNSNKIVIGPKQWVLPENINKNIELIFPSWIKI
jgi:hypothetical protein